MGLEDKGSGSSLIIFSSPLGAMSSSSKLQSWLGTSCSTASDVNKVTSQPLQYVSDSSIPSASLLTIFPSSSSAIEVGLGIPSEPSTDEITELMPLPVIVMMCLRVRLRHGIEFLAATHTHTLC